MPARLLDTLLMWHLVMPENAAGMFYKGLEFCTRFI